MTLSQKQLYDKSNTPIQPVVERFIGAETTDVIQPNTDYYASEDGWLVAGAMLNTNGSFWIYLDDLMAFNAINDIGGSITGNMGTTYSCPVKKGQKFKVSLTNAYNSYIRFRKTA